MALENFAYTVLNFVNWIAVLLIILGLWELLQAFSGGRLGNALGNWADRVGATGIGDALRGHGPEIRPLLDRMQQLEALLTERINTVGNNVNTVGTNVAEIRDIVTRIEVKIDQIQHVINQWMDFFRSVTASLTQIEADIANNKGNIEAVRRIVEENKENLAIIVERCGQFKTDLEGMKAELDRGLTELKQKIDEINVNIGRIGRDITDINTNTSKIETEVGEIKDEIKKLPDKFKAEFEVKFEEIKTILAELKGKIKNVNVKALKKDIKAMIEESTIDVKGHVTKETDELEDNLKKKLDDMMAKIKELIEKIKVVKTTEEAEMLVKGPIGDGNLILQNSGQMQDILKNFLNAYERLGAGTEAVEPRINQNLEDIRSAAALLKSLTEHVEKMSEDVSALNAKYADKIEQAKTVVIKERNYLIAELREMRGLEKNIITGNVKKIETKEKKFEKVKEHFEALKIFARKQTFRTDVNKVENAVMALKDLLDERKIEEILEDIRAFQAESLVDAGDKLKDEIKDKELSNVDWTKVRETSRQLTKFLLGWEISLNKLRDMLAAAGITIPD